MAAKLQISFLCKGAKRARPDGDQEMDDNELLLQCHDYAELPDPAAMEEAREMIQAQQLMIDELRKRVSAASLKQAFSFQRFSASDDNIRFYTRFASTRHLVAFWEQIEPAAKRMAQVRTASKTADPYYQDPANSNAQGQILPLIDEMFLFFMYLSLGLEERDLADRFNIPRSTVSRLIWIWAHFLYTLLGGVVIWMSPEAIREAMPSVFGRYSDTQVIVDCTEIRCQVAPSVLQQYQSHTTQKGLIGISPHGAVTFISSLYPGSISYEELFRESGIVRLLDKDMAVMVDKKCRIDHLVPGKVYRPPFVSEKSRLSRDKVCLTTHVARTIGHLKENLLFDTVIPLHLSGAINQLFAVAALLANYQNKPLVQT